MPSCAFMPGFTVPEMEERGCCVTSQHSQARGSRDRYRVIAQGFQSLSQHVRVGRKRGIGKEIELLFTSSQKSGTHNLNGTRENKSLPALHPLQAVSLAPLSIPVLAAEHQSGLCLCRWTSLPGELQLLIAGMGHPIFLSSITFPLLQDKKNLLWRALWRCQGCRERCGY